MQTKVKGNQLRFEENLSLQSQKIVNLSDPSEFTDAVNKRYVDNSLNSIDCKTSVVVASTSNVDISSPPDSIDDFLLTSGDRILLKNQNSGTTNGIYVFNGSGNTMTRALDANSNSKINTGMFTFVESGTVNAQTGWILNTVNPSLGITNLTFQEFTSHPTNCVFKEVPSGDIDGVNREFILANNIVVNSEQVFLNGNLQQSGESADYTISGSTINFNVAPIIGEIVLVNYLTDISMVWQTSDGEKGDVTVSSSGAIWTVNSANALKSDTTTVNVSSSTAPISGQVLTATSDTTAIWQSPIIIEGNGTASAVIGSDTTARSIYGALAISSGKFTTVGDAQNVKYILRGITNNATSKVLTTNGSIVSSINQIILPNNSAFSFTAKVLAHRTDVISGLENRAAWHIDGLATRDNNASTTIVTGIINEISNTPNWTVDILENTDNGSIKFSVTGESNKTIRWLAIVETCEITL